MLSVIRNGIKFNTTPTGNYKNVFQLLKITINWFDTLKITKTNYIYTNQTEVTSGHSVYFILDYFMVLTFSSIFYIKVVLTDEILKRRCAANKIERVMSQQVEFAANSQTFVLSEL